MLFFWKFLSFLGSEEFYLLIMPALIWCGDAALGLRVGVLFLLSANLNGAAKFFFLAPRPAWLDAKIVALATENSFGFPSGHAQNAMAVWGLLAAKTKTRVAWGIALALIALIGMSRLALLVHFPCDVLGGWLIGAVLLGAFLKLEKPAAYWLKKQDFIAQLVVCGGLSLVIVAVTWWIRFQAVSGMAYIQWFNEINSTDMAVMASFQESFATLPTVKAPGALFGLLIGACWMHKNGGYVKAKNKIARFVIGLIGVFVFWFWLGKMLPRGEDFLLLSAAYVRYALVGFWISAGAPLVFRRVERRRRL